MLDPVSLLLVAALAVAAFLLLSKKSDSQVNKKVNRLPGPRAYPVIGTMLPFLFLKRNELFKFGQSIITRYESPFRSWTGSTPQIHLKRPQDVEVVLKSSEHLDKGHFYVFLHKWLGTGLLTSTGQKWHSHRKMITPTFHFKILENFVEVFSEKSEILVQKLEKEVGSQGFDVYPYITKCALDIICETAMGTQIHAQEEQGSEYVKAVYDMSEMTIRRMLSPWLHLETIFKLTKIGRRTAECLNILHGFTTKVIAERKEQLRDATPGTPDEDFCFGKKRRKAFLDLLLEASIDGVKLTDEELREEVDTFMFEGHDTTSAGMCWAIFLLGLHPDVQEKAYEEQVNIFQGSSRSASLKDISEMKYLERVLKEALRLYPSVPTISRTVKTDVTIDGYEIPAGCSITMHIYNVHRNPEQFPDPEKFDPDRFLPEKIANRHPYSYIPFSAGPRNCIGQKFAMLEEKTVLSYILRHYRITSLDKRENVTLIGELVLRPERGIRVTVTPRND